MSFLSHFGLFALEAVTIVIAILITFAGIVAIKAKSKNKPELTITELGSELQEQKDKMQEICLDKKSFKSYKKQQKEHYKAHEKEHKPRLFVLDFVGDIKASAVENLRREITAVLGVATKHDEVLVKIESGGGTVNSYGLGASQLQRITNQNIPLVVCVDKVAASGGYLMASVANKILAAPFAIIGSIGVVAQLPNFHRWLKKHDIDFEMLTAGDYKRTLTVFGENTDEGRTKFGQDLNSIHNIFKDHISDHRKQTAIDKVSTGEHWLAKEAFELKLVDKLITSDEYISKQIDNYKIVTIKYEEKPTLVAKLLKPAANILNF